MLTYQHLDMPSQEGVKAIDLPFDYSRIGRRWEAQYGITEIPLLVHADNGKIYDDHRLKGYFLYEKYRRMLSRRYVIFPNQEVGKVVHRVVEENGLTVQKEYFSHNNDAQYWQILKEDVSDRNYVEKGDVVKVGCIIRNSIGAGVALGADVFTFRVFCSNGAVARGNDFGLRLSHVRDFETMYNLFVNGIGKVLKRAEEMVEYYRKSAKLNMNRRIAEEIAKKVPKKYFPDCMDWNKKEKRPVLVREDNLWKAFNDITEKSWKSEDAGFLRISGIEQRAHTILVNAVEGRYV